MLKFTKSKPPRIKFYYNDSDIEEQIKDDFFDICYLCEECTRHTQVDHFYPQARFKRLGNNWNNLFNACEKCNNIKRTKANSSSKDRIINCCKLDPSLLFNHTIKFLSVDKVEIEILPLSNFDPRYKLRIHNTIKLLDKVYNDKGKSNSFKDLRKEIIEEIAEFTKDIDDYKKILDPRYKDSLKRKIIKKIQKATRNKKYSSYISFKRQILKDDKSIGHEFLNYFD